MEKVKTNLRVCYVKSENGVGVVTYETIASFSESPKMFRDILFDSDSRCPTNGKVQIAKKDILEFIPGWDGGSPAHGAVYFWEGYETRAKSVLLEAIQERAAYMVRRFSDQAVTLNRLMGNIIVDPAVSFDINVGDFGIWKGPESSE